MELRESSRLEHYLKPKRMSRNEWKMKQMIWLDSTRPGSDNCPESQARASEIKQLMMRGVSLIPVQSGSTAFSPVEDLTSQKAESAPQSIQRPLTSHQRRLPLRSDVASYQEILIASNINGQCVSSTWPTLSHAFTLAESIPTFSGLAFNVQK